MPHGTEMQKLYEPRPSLQRRQWYEIEAKLWYKLMMGQITGEWLLLEMIMGSCDDLLDSRIEQNPEILGMIDTWREDYSSCRRNSQRRRMAEGKSKDKLVAQQWDEECFSRQGSGLRATPKGI